ncbi:MAG: enoyl-CoA hydratase/isomerase family protein [Planctomycetota bacterium]|nr:enoyl-CoA hydratase/isomerase family protein [Planctomycetota bacterium]
MPELASLHIDEGVATLTMHRPDARNALSLDLILALGERLSEIEANDDLKALIFAGEGKCFCAGMDLKGVMSDPLVMADMLRGLSRITRRLRRLSIPVIARVQGAAVGGGCGLMVVCDFAITHPEAKVGFPEVDLGLCPAVVAPWVILRIGAGAARAMLLKGGTMSGEAGLEANLVTHLVEKDQLESTSIDLARALGKGGSSALAVTKNWLNKLDGSLDDEILDQAAELSASVIASDAAQQRLQELFGN